MKKNKVIFLDRDGTINKDFGYVYKTEDLEFLPGVVEGLKLLQDNGYMLIIVTNQSGISRKYFSIDDYNIFNSYLINELKKYNIEIKEVYMCPHRNEDNCECRKPKTQLFWNAIKKYNIDLDNSYAIGDKERDLAICNETSIKGILLTDKSNNDYICKSNFYEAAKYIIKDGNDLN